MSCYEALWSDRFTEGTLRSVLKIEGHEHVMDTHDTKQIVEAAQAAFELKIVERLRKTEEDLVNRVRTVESNLQNMKQIAWAVAAVAVIFGISGAWGWKLLLEAKKELEVTSRQVTQLSTDVHNLEPITRLHIARLQQAGIEQLDKFRGDAKRETDAASARLRDAEEDVKRTSNYQRLDTRISSIEQKTNSMSLDRHRFSITVDPAHYDFPVDGNMNFGFDNGIVCFAANDKNRPNTNDLKRCFH